MNRRDFLRAGLGSAAFAALPRGAAAAGAATAHGASADLGPTITDFEVRTSSVQKGRKAHFFIDDAIWFLRDITRQRPKSVFDTPFMKGLKDSHDRWGLKVQINLFYRTDFFYGMDEFTLADVTDAYRHEWMDNADWIKFGMHSLQEFPDYPFVNSSYGDLRRICDMVFGEVARFADAGMCAKAVVPHWGPVSKEGCRALADAGMKVVWCSHGRRYAYGGDPSSLPYGHGFRLVNNRKPETALFRRGANANAAIDASISGYNHLSEAQVRITQGTFNAIYDRDTRICYKRFCNAPCLNLYRVEDVASGFEKAAGSEFICFADHEQYFFPEYFACQPDYMEKIGIGAKWLHERGYGFVFMEDTVD